MAAAKTVTLFLMDGSPSGRIKCSLTNWIGRVYLIPRTDLAKSKDRPELNQTGVYILLGTDDVTGEEKAYVGQARERKNGKGVLARTIEHVGEEKLDYFTHAIMMITSDDSFGPTEISYLENAFYQQASEAGRVRTTNSNDPSPGKVTEEKEAELNEFIKYAKIAIRSLGYRLFDPIDETKTAAKLTTKDSTQVEPLLYLDGRGASGQGRQTADGFVVFSGAKIRKEMLNSAPDSAKANRVKYAERISADFELLKDTLFSSPSAAAAFLTGASSNGKKYWKNEQGITLRDLEQNELKDVIG
ncbi:GIY-YIG nuclease family protein [Corynebacterium sp. HS2168-gen11]|uniref:GIY-YIG nuclease family protein n=1 Tax=Corynebacterium sp. HS2168-gen11 TaxID=2974027 RepID=UPI00216B1610|nr:GIY-YIG nuclease family protein [Corynebacterium sp. HS2168-gen11]MCS4536036.1 GIY-YIG nuclease family protein [Corynebacterium sp. HS2168-gen11]